MKKLFLAGAALFSACVLLGIVQMWFHPWAPETYVKLELTLAGLLAIVVVAWYIKRESVEDEATRRGDRLDGE
jgi:uncharacterized membrane protein YcjF (UPF0283 family)